MTRYKVKEGTHGIKGRNYRVGEMFDVENDNLDQGSDGRFFEKIGKVAVEKKPEDKVDETVGEQKVDEPDLPPAMTDEDLPPPPRARRGRHG